MEKNNNIDVFIREHETIFCLLLAALFYSVMVWRCGFDHYLNFFPSLKWTMISMILSPVIMLGVFIPFIKNETMTYDGIKIAFSKVTIVSLFGFLAYIPITYGVGPAITSLFYTNIEKDVSGTKIDYLGYRSRDYYIDTPDLPEGVIAKLYITEEEFKSIPQQVRLHVTLKQSFFGMAVKHYTFLSRSG